VDVGKLPNHVKFVSLSLSFLISLFQFYILFIIIVGGYNINVLGQSVHKQIKCFLGRSMFFNKVWPKTSHIALYFIYIQLNKAKMKSFLC
jgi:hypothetical protein